MLLFISNNNISIEGTLEGLVSLEDLTALIEEELHTNTGNVISLNLKPIMCKHKTVFISTAVWTISFASVPLH